MEEITLLERVLDQAYGTPPRIVENTWLNNYWDYLQNRRYAPGSFFTGLFTAYYLTQSDGAYDGATHTCYIPPPGRFSPLFPAYALLPELSNGYTTQRNADFTEKNSRSALLTALDQKIPLSEALVEQALIMDCLDEGIADYLAISAQKLQVQDGRNPEEVYCFEREWALANGTNLPDGQKVTGPTPLSRDLAQRFSLIGPLLVNSLLYLNFIDEPRAQWSYLHDWKDIVHNYATLFGYYFIRISCDDQTDHLGERLGPFIWNPPAQLNTLEETVLRSFH